MRNNFFTIINEQQNQKFTCSRTDVNQWTFQGEILSGVDSGLKNGEYNYTDIGMIAVVLEQLQDSNNWKIGMLGKGLEKEVADVFNVYKSLK